LKVAAFSLAEKCNIIADSSFDIKINSPKNFKQRRLQGYAGVGFGTPYFVKDYQPKSYPYYPYESVHFVWKPCIVFGFNIEDKKTGFVLRLSHSETVNEYKIHNSDPNFSFPPGAEVFPTRDYVKTYVYSDFSVCIFKKFLKTKKIHPFVGLGYFEDFFDSRYKGPESIAGVDIELSKTINISLMADKKNFRNYYISYAINNPSIITDITYFKYPFNLLLGVKIKLF
jgi:hypothetical protein